jgi:hypothetical protein
MSFIIIKGFQLRENGQLKRKSLQGSTCTLHNSLSGSCGTCEADFIDFGMRSHPWAEFVTSTQGLNNPWWEKPLRKLDQLEAAIGSKGPRKTIQHVEFSTFKFPPFGHLRGFHDDRISGQ